MPKPFLRSNSFRKIKVRLPSGKTIVHYERKRNGVAHCAICHKPLRAVPTNRVNKYSRKEKRPERQYGGYLCHKCLEELIKLSMRGTS
ncbi:50S ribosomal protein L34e [Acidianus sp. RZ1]|uniref:50S ribosomal protein L34e n=1 Tax=Acidianus sp. RZ1 TaxID=1540082 RepID=UPI0014925C84|nr:50S ribosomal protein L34e [Acidianus sp. RZ1]NON63481.1 50S ribosomal protein L34e [Acidianus sp. RZ1]